jgi:hypothetical protein
LRYFIRASIVLGVGISIGVLVGWLVFSVSALTGKPLFIVGGGLIGLIIAAIGLAYNRGAAFLTLSEMTVNFPQLGEMKFVINSEYRRVAWKLFVETLTRISTQPLGCEDGSLREALASLYSLFSATRDLLKNMPPSTATSQTTVEMLAVKMLNEEIRPFLSKWHVRLKKFETTHPGSHESEWPENPDCRKELEAARKRVINYAKAFGQLSGVAKLDEFFDSNHPIQGK